MRQRLADRRGAPFVSVFGGHARLDAAGEKLLPLDTVFVVNRFLAAVSQAVIE